LSQKRRANPRIKKTAQKGIGVNIQRMPKRMKTIPKAMRIKRGSLSKRFQRGEFLT